jgi:lactoylglutathione lyase
MKLAKNALDVGLFTNHREAMLEFWQQRVGLPFDELLPTGRGAHQLRHRIDASILKINHVRDALEPAPPSGYRRLTIARSDIASPIDLADPDGNAVRLVPNGHRNITQLELELAVRDLAAARTFYREVLAFEALADDRFRCGDSLVALREDPAAAIDTPMRSPGFRYTTVQVYDVVAEHRGILARGGREGSAPVRLGDVAYISFVRDPDGNWIEISQRKSLTGSLD